ncbi:MAG: hypothetical protein WC371_05890 [Parachlamydiales bacterium]|jgi:hypothetical protein
MRRIIFFSLLPALFFAEAPFHFQHQLGELLAQRAKISAYPCQNQLTEKLLLKELSLSLEKGLLLKSDLALLDLESKTLFFSSLANAVTLENTLRPKTPFLLSSQKASFVQETAPTLKAALEKKIVFQDNIRLRIAEKFLIEAERAEYFQDQITLFGPLQGCRLKSGDKTILSQKVVFDLNQGSLFLEDVHGALKSLPIKAEEAITLVSGKLTLLDHGRRILLQEGVKISHSGGAELICDFLELSYLNKKMSRIVTSPKAKVYLKTPSPASFTSCGPITIDLLQKTITTAEEGIVFKEKDSLVAAQKASLKFKDLKHLSDIEYITLEKEVHFFSSKIKHTNNLGLADKLHFDVAKRTITLESLPPKKVVFWEEASSLTLSADKIQIQKGEKEAIKGFGNVRFSLKKEEEKIFEAAVHKYLLEKTKKA